MATIATSSSGAHVRSTSWFGDVHPLFRAIEDHLLLLTQRAECSACRKLGVLKNMYEVVEVYLHLQTTKTQKAFTGFEDVSEGFLEVLDICSTIRDVLMQIKEQVRELESSLRRRLNRSKSGGGGDQEAFLAREIEAYVFKRRALSRTVAKQLKKTEDKMKKRKNKNDVSVMKRVEETSFDVLVSLLIEVVTRNQKDHNKQRSRGIVSRVFNRKNQEVDGEELKKLRETEDEIEETEKELECVYKKLVKTRVSLLNMLTL